MGPGGLEPPTSPLSGARSSQLSYEPSGGCLSGRQYIVRFGLRFVNEVVWQHSQ